MNISNEYSQEISELDLQRCVDGELSSAQRRELLRRLDRVGTGWRELALMFIEDREFRGGCQEFLAGPLTATPMPLKKTPKNWLNVSWPLVAASVVIGLVTPFAWRGFLKPESQPQIAQKLPAPTSNEGEPPGPGVPGGIVPRMLEPMAESPAAVATTEQAPKPVTNLNLVSDGGGEPVSIPVYSSEHFPEVWPKGGSLLPEELDEAFQQRGLRLERQPNVIYYRNEDGSFIAVPVESFHVRPEMQ